MLVPAALLLAALTVSCGGGNEEGKRTASYKTYTVDTTSRTVESSYSATIRGRQDIDIYPQVSGTITKVCVTEGQKVRKGDILFIIDQVPYKAALMTAEANVAAAEAGVATAQLTYDSKVKLFDEKVISQFELQSAENALLTAKATLAQCEAQRVNAENNLSYTTVSSPADGVVGTIPYRQGALVSSAMAQPLTTISDNSQMYVYFSFNETQLLSLLKQYGSLDATLEEMPDSEEKAYCLEEIEKEDFLPLINSTANSYIPYQFNEKELAAIIDKQSGHYPLLAQEKSKIVSLLTFRRPYYVGPLKGD